MTKKITTLVSLAIVVGLGFSVPAAHAQASDKTPDYSDKTPADFADEATMKEVATGGVPMGRWKEGLLFEGISPQPWLTSAANWFPGAEDVQPEDIHSQFIRDAEIDPDLYYPEGYKPVLMENWPTDKPIFVPEEFVPESMKSPPADESGD